MSLTLRKKSESDVAAGKRGNAKIRRVDPSENVLSDREAGSGTQARVEGGTIPAADECPVIRANRIVFAPAGAGRMRIVFF